MIIGFTNFTSISVDVYIYDLKTLYNVHFYTIENTQIDYNELFCKTAFIFIVSVKNVNIILSFNGSRTRVFLFRDIFCILDSAALST